MPNLLFPDFAFLSLFISSSSFGAFLSIVIAPSGHFDAHRVHT
ncbi:hypothetical protein MBBAR_12c00380 [Methanobrevibacter arboriphilus JCM 13429 = DSM 1125]|uniref:Uncharacterized protein n=1 Tax=Methanobrevibacter arboriphilus JCM 13429 = DSM 1125 TaxID=1300164 RepID=A0A1V6N1Q1_METAZ|nr:hypothetical protein MBBAR_12c00380 [Methanobrevibacter arboriphilus JCM 13429 = DSM 1125]